MSLTLDLSPDIIQQLQESADRECTSVPALAQRLLESALRQTPNSELTQTDAAKVWAKLGEVGETSEVAKIWASLGETDEERNAFINGTIKRFRETYAYGKRSNESPSAAVDAAH